MVEASLQMQKYFQQIDNGIKICYDLANKAREKGLDPDTKVEIPLARDMAERVEGLIAVVAPQIKSSGISQRIKELERELGSQNWKIAFLISEEIALEKFCKFKNKLEAMEVALRSGLAYITNGVVSSPLEGFVRLELKKRKDGKEYFCLYFGGPIRSAGTTAVCIFLGVADYLRVRMGYEPYDPTEEEIKRTFSELEYFHERVTNLQYFPSEEEAEFITKNLPIQIDGDASEEIDVPNYKDLSRISSNKLRNGFCLVVAEGLCQKFAKFWGKFSKWNNEMGMGHWIFLEEFVKLQKLIRAKGAVKKLDTTKIVPDYTYIKDLVAGRPILGYPLRTGAFRLRLGRARTIGLSDTALSPATMFILDDFIAYGTQLKTERPGKATTISSCDRIEGPIVKLKNGDVIFVENEKKAKEIRKEIQEIIFLGDILINYGYFLNRGHTLAPVGYCEDWWALELEKNSGNDKIKYKEIISDPGKYILEFDFCYNLSKEFSIPLHPRFTYHWNDVNLEEFKRLLEWLKYGIITEDKIILSVIGLEDNPKRILELIGVPHKFANKEYVVIEEDWAKAFKVSLGFNDVFDFDKILNEIKEDDKVLDVINKVSLVKLRDKSGLYIGARMGRPEKSKMREMKGSPHTLFPVGEEGGRLRSLQEAIYKGKVTADFTNYYCENCKEDMVYFKCDKCRNNCILRYTCRTCDSKLGDCGHNPRIYSERSVNIVEYYERAIKRLGIHNAPQIVKGVRGTANKMHIPELLEKGILRAMNNVTVNKDGTVRYDMTEMSITHFKPKEIGTSIETLKECGYLKDVYGNDLVNIDQILELKCQDIILPACPESTDEGADVIFNRVANFLDDLLEKVYGLPRFYNIKKKEDLVGHLLIGLSPHTAAGIVARIIGFSKVQVMLASPLMHSIMRRDCFTYDTYIPIMKNGIWKNVKIGEIVEELKPDKKTDLFGTLSKEVENYYTIGLNKKGKISVVKVNDFTKHLPSKILKIKTNDGRELKVTETHKFLVYDNNKTRKAFASELAKGMKLVTPIRINIPPKNIEFIDFKKYFLKRDDIMIRNIKPFINECIQKLGGNIYLRKIMNLPKNTIYNFLSRDSFPLPMFLFLSSMINVYELPKDSYLVAKRDNVNLPNKIYLNEDVLNLIGLYVAEGYTRKKISNKGLYQIELSVTEEEIRQRIFKTMKINFNLKPTHINKYHIVYSSKILYEFFVEILKCGRNAHEKRIPEIVMNLSLEKLKFFLQGYFDGNGSVSKTDFRVCCDSVSEQLLQDLEFSLKRYSIFTKRYLYKKELGPKLKAFYIKNNRPTPQFEITKLIIPSTYYNLFYNKIGFSLIRKQKILKYLIENTKPYEMKIDHDDEYVYPEIKEIIECPAEITYCLDVDNHIINANGLLVGQCDADEAGVMLLLDGLLNFSPKLLSDHRGATQDEPLVLSSIIVPSEVDDMVFDMDVSWRYPLELYEACMQYKPANEVKIETLKSRLGNDKQYEGYGFTHDTEDFNNTVRCSKYKTIPTMQEKVEKQMILSEKIRAIDINDVARLVVERHFLRDIKGNLRKFSSQQFRCVGCNKKYRRPPLKGNCLECSGKLIFTISEGSVIKYLEPSLRLVEKYNLPPYLKQTLELTKQRIEAVFGKEREKQVVLNKWFS